MMASRYKHTQIGYFLISVYGVLILIFGWIYLVTGATAMTIGLILLFLALGMFARMTVEVDGEVVEFILGFGIVRKRFPLVDIASCQAVRNRWWYGLGIRYTPHGWLFGVSGLDAVELKMKDGRRYRIGTDDPQGLGEAIVRLLGASKSDI